MINLHTLLRAVASLVLANAGAYADISPTKFIGSSIAPKGNSSVRMEKAKVEIVWGTPCSLSATFVMDNPLPTPEEIEVGFPVPDEGRDISPPESDSEKQPSGSSLRAAPHDPLSISFDGEKATILLPGSHDMRREWLWYHCKHMFKPGQTEVVVKTILRTSLVYATPFRESLFYCIETGGKWAGNIGEEEVTIRFPNQPEKDQITDAVPAGYQVDGNCVRWRFADFKPTGKEFDIALTYVRPDIMRVITALRDDFNKNPGSSAAAIKLAKHLLALGNEKSNCGFPPSELSKDEYEAILTKIGASGERKAFVEHYKMRSESRYEEASSEWTEERVDLIQILADAGYRDQESQCVFILEAEKLLKDVLAHDPHNAEAWNVYLASYWRFSFAAVGHWFGFTLLSRAQAKLIESAAQNCPNDECIQLWLKLRRSDPEKRDMTTLQEAIKRKGFMQLEFPKIEYGYY